MKTRVLSIEVREGENLLFKKSPASVQDVMASLTLFERDGLVLTLSIKDSVSEEQQAVS